MARTPSQYQEEYVAFLERATDDLSDISAFEGIDSWMQHVQEFIMGNTGVDISGGTQSFIEDAFDFFNESIASAGWRADIDASRFRDVETGRFVGRDAVREFLRHIPFFGLFGGSGDT